MKYFISLAMMLLLSFTFIANADAHSCYKKKKKKHRTTTSACYKRYYIPGTCERGYDCQCGGEYEACSPGRYVFCRTEMRYHHGRNSGSLEVCY